MKKFHKVEVSPLAETAQEFTAFDKTKHDTGLRQWKDGE